MKVDAEIELFESEGFPLQTNEIELDLRNIKQNLPVLVEDLLEDAVKEYDSMVNPEILDLYEALADGEYLMFYNFGDSIASDGEYFYFDMEVTTRSLHERGKPGVRVTIRILTNEISQAILKEMQGNSKGII